MTRMSCPRPRATDGPRKWRSRSRGTRPSDDAHISHARQDCHVEIVYSERTTSRARSVTSARRANAEDERPVAEGEWMHTEASLLQRSIASSLLFAASAVVLYYFGFSAEIHNAAHDARHAFAFPCH